MGILLFFLIKTTVELSYNVNRKSDIGYRNDQQKTNNTEIENRISKNVKRENQLATQYSENQILGIPSPVIIAFSATLLWIVHPLHTQSVTYIVQRMTSMAALFYIFSLFLYVKGRIALKNNRAVFQGEKRVIASEATQSQGLYGSSVMRLLRAFALAMTPVIPWIFFSVSILSGLCALGSKQIAATLPLFILLYEWYFFQDLRTDWIKKRTGIILGIIVLIGILAVLYIGTNPLDWLLSGYERRDFTLGQRVMTEFRVVILYISLLIFPYPSRLTLDYDFPLSYSLINPVTTLLSLFVIIALFILAIYTARKHRLISFSILWFLGNLVIESSVIPLELVYEHRTYLPSMFIGLIVVLPALRYIKYQWFNLILILITVSLFSFWTYERNEIWSDELTFLEDAVTKAPNKARVHNNLGTALFKLGNTDDAITHYSDAVRIDPEYAEAIDNLANAFFVRGDIERSVAYHFQAIHIKPDFAEAHYNLAYILADQGKIRDAIIHYEEALRITPEFFEAHNNLGIIYANLGKTEEAIKHYRLALNVNPGFIDSHINLAAVLYKEGDSDEAITHYNNALSIDPEDFRALVNLGDLFLKRGSHSEAVKRYSRALQIKPSNMHVLNNIGVAFMKLKHYDEAEVYFKKVIKIRDHLLDILVKREENLKAKNGDIEHSGSQIKDQLESTREDYAAHYKLGNPNLSKKMAYGGLDFYIKRASFIQQEYSKALNNLAIVYTVKEQYDDALSLLNEIIVLQPENYRPYYNIACIYAKQNEKDEALRWLDKSIDKGFDSWELLETDMDLENIRNTEYYKELLMRHRVTEAQRHRE